jgi:hypothetical protein
LANPDNRADRAAEEERTEVVRTDDDDDRDPDHRQPDRRPVGTPVAAHLIFPASSADTRFWIEAMARKASRR